MSDQKIEFTITGNFKGDSFEYSIKGGGCDELKEMQTRPLNNKELKEYRELYEKHGEMIGRVQEYIETFKKAIEDNEEKGAKLDMTLELILKTNNDVEVTRR